MKMFIKTLSLAWTALFFTGCFTFSSDLWDDEKDKDSSSDSDTNSDTCTGDSCLVPDDTDTDSQTDMDAGGDTDTQVDGGPDGGPQSDAGTDSDVCGEGETDACEDGYYCKKGACRPCTEDEACGPTCSACALTQVCTGDTPDTAKCVCADETCGEGYRCDLEISDECILCDTDNACGAACTDCTQLPQTPLCDMTAADKYGNAGVCVECTDNSDCRDSGAPNASNLGICTPDKTCTCYVQDETEECTGTCPDGFVCAEDYATHFVCLRTCDAENSSTSQGGLFCEQRRTASASAYVWAPMTTCYAFDKFGEDCSGASAMCSVDGADGLEDGRCLDGLCTFSCYDAELDAEQDAWCPTDNCGSLRLCE